MNRRRFLLTSLTGAFAVPLAGEAQQAGRVWRVGYFVGSGASTNRDLDQAFRDALKELGYVEGKNVVMESRWADGHYDRLSEIAAEFVRLHVDVIVCVGDPVIAAAKQATSTIPIVMASVGDPVGRGFVATLARPGGNVTGVSNFAGGLSGKWLELLKEIVPKLSTAAILSNGGNPTHALLWAEAQDPAKRFGLTVRNIEVRRPDEIDDAFASMHKDRIGGVIVFPDPLLGFRRAQIAQLAEKNRIPSVFSFREDAKVGGLISYGPSLAANRRRAAVYVDRIFKGAKPAELPVEQPATFDLFVNVRTAKSLGLTIPPSLLARADQVIE